MIAPTPRAVNCTTPSVRFKLCSPASLVSSRSNFSGFRASKLAIGFFSLFRGFAPYEIDRRAEQYDDQPGPGIVRLVNQQQDFNQAGGKDVEGRQNWVSESLVRSLHF